VHRTKDNGRGAAHPLPHHGPAPGSGGDASRFRVTYLPNGELMVTLLPSCDLVGVLVAARLITQQLLAGDTKCVTFTRDQAETVQESAATPS
jgi:hypothetical protein